MRRTAFDKPIGGKLKVAKMKFIDGETWFDKCKRHGVRYNTYITRVQRIKSSKGYVTHEDKLKAATTPAMSRAEVNARQGNGSRRKDGRNSWGRLNDKRD